LTGKQRQNCYLALGMSNSCPEHPFLIAGSFLAFLCLILYHGIKVASLAFAQVAQRTCLRPRLILVHFRWLWESDLAQFWAGSISTLQGKPQVTRLLKVHISPSCLYDAVSCVSTSSLHLHVCFRSVVKWHVL